MKPLRTLAVLLIATVIGLASCKDTDISYISSIEQMKDSVFNHYAGITGITINVKEASILDITVLDPKLTADEIQRQQLANELGAMALRIFPKDNTLEKGELRVAKDQNSMESDDRTTTPIDIEALRKANTPQ